MSKVYLNQSNLSLILDTEVDLAGATTTEIKYIKPDGTEGAFVGSIYDSTNVKYDFTGTELDQISCWIFWAYVIFSDGRNAPGEPVTMQVYKQGT